MLKRNFVPGGRSRSQLKDIHNALSLAAAGNLDLPLANSVEQSFRSLVGCEYSCSLRRIDRVKAGDGRKFSSAARTVPPSGAPRPKEWSVLNEPMSGCH